jgi:hypothetical protein
MFASYSPISVTELVSDGVIPDGMYNTATYKKGKRQGETYNSVIVENVPNHHTGNVRKVYISNFVASFNIDGHDVFVASVGHWNPIGKLPSGKMAYSDDSGNTLMLFHMVGGKWKVCDFSDMQAFPNEAISFLAFDNILAGLQFYGWNATIIGFADSTTIYRQFAHTHTASEKPASKPRTRKQASKRDNSQPANVLLDANRAVHTDGASMDLSDVLAKLIAELPTEKRAQLAETLLASLF